MGPLNSVGERMCRLPEPDDNNETDAVSATRSAEPSAATSEAAADAEGELGMGSSSLVQTQRPARDLSQLFARGAAPEPLECSDETGTSDVDEADTRYGGTSTNFVPNAAVSSCNDGRSYCNRDEDVVAHTLEYDAELSDERGYLFDTRNVHPVRQAPEPQVPEESERASGVTVSVGANLSFCAPEACTSVSSEVGIDDDGDIAASVAASVQVGLQAPGVGLTPYVKVTNAPDISDVAAGTESNVGVDFGAGSVDAVHGANYDGISAGLGPSPLGVHTGVSYAGRASVVESHE